MDIYQLILTHNRRWSPLEMICFAAVFLIAAAILFFLYGHHKIILSQVIAGLLLVVYLGIVFASTVFTRNSDGIWHYELMPFWSWREVLLGNTYMLTEIILNVILFLPIGILLSVLFHRTFRWRQGLLIGVLLSSVIEITQLVSCRGLFEWDDMLHNGIGCMLGCLLADLVIRVRIDPASR